MNEKKLTPQEIAQLFRNVLGKQNIFLTDDEMKRFTTEITHEATGPEIDAGFVPAHQK